MVGFVGTNGSCKNNYNSSNYRFLKPTSGAVYVNGLESLSNVSEMGKHVGFVPGKIAFPDLPTARLHIQSCCFLMLVRS